MKKILFLVTILLACVGCSKEDEDFNILVSLNELEFSPNGGEQIIEISSMSDWNCEYDTEWLLVRQQADKIRVIAESNPLSESRSCIIKLTIEGRVISKIVISQLGVKLNVE
ncbi:MAG: BACON domain-containing protein, partial [Bacteroidaceae bacterium]|nr:BACON domain-containing protein [Bacteroidaceae bacterium]